MFEPYLGTCPICGGQLACFTNGMLKCLEVPHHFAILQKIFETVWRTFQQKTEKYCISSRDTKELITALLDGNQAEVQTTYQEILVASQKRMKIYEEIWRATT